MRENEKVKESWYSGLLNKFKNMTIGAAIAETPAIMIASGWRLNNKGEYVLDLQDSEGAKLLRDNLSSISEISPTNPIGINLDFRRISPSIPLLHEKIDKATK